jgi:hypothetical protein
MEVALGLIFILVVRERASSSQEAVCSHNIILSYTPCFKYHKQPHGKNMGKLIPLPATLFES